MTEPITHLGNIEEITIESDERGWELHFVSTDHGRFIANIHMVATDLLEQVRPIDHWHEEGRAAVLDSDDNPDYTDEERDAGTLSYAPDDPKSDGYHDRMSAIYDNRDKT